MPVSTAPRRKKKKPLDFAATCSAGLETLVSSEIETFGGYDIRTTPGAVTWSGNLESGYRACLWSRFASRILLTLAQFQAPDTDTLYQEISRIEWDRHIGTDSTFAAYCTLSEASITHSHFAALRIKDAIVDQFRDRTGERPNVDVRKPGIRLNLHVKGIDATLALDLSGDSLHRRGYRVGAGEAPLKETLAAAIVQLSGCSDTATPDSFLLDPFCGSGTLLIEAALLLSDSAPGLLRKTFGFMYWNRHDAGLWKRLVDESLDRESKGQEKQLPHMLGYDADPHAVAAARKNIDAAGLTDEIIIKQRQLADLQCPGKDGMLLTNPPYGERLSDKLAVKYLYRCIGDIFHHKFPGWRMGFFTANSDLADMLKVKWQQRHSLYNGPIKCRLLVGDWRAQEGREDFTWQLTDYPDSEPGADLANRLQKNAQTLLPWSAENDITCFRLYDADIPEYNFAVDFYEGWIHVQEYTASATVDPEKADERFSLALQVIRTLLNVRRSRLFIKTRPTRKGKQPDRKGKSPGKLYEVHEGGSRFLVNFTDYQDTGLLLHHRLTRAMIGRLAEGKTFLNLYGYTGTATVYAAAGGATSTTTVDISDKYLGHTLANLSLNGYGGPLHRTIQANCLEWLHGEKERYGFIFVDPPPFSTAQHHKQAFDLQRDHEILLHLAMQRLSRNGLLIFSTNFKKFRLSDSILADFSVQEISEQTIPADFIRNKRIHRCWELRHHSSADEHAEILDQA